MRPKETVPQFRIEAGSSRISPEDLKPWGELRGWLAWTILSFATTDCRDKEARLRLLEAYTDDVIEHMPDYYAKYGEAIRNGLEKESARLWKALNQLLRECQWSRERNGFFVESRSGKDIGVAHMLREAEEAHTRYVHDHGA